MSTMKTIVHDFSALRNSLVVRTVFRTHHKLDSYRHFST